jgi:hypothetical protein
MLPGNGSEINGRLINPRSFFVNFVSFQMMNISNNLKQLRFMKNVQKMGEKKKETLSTWIIEERVKKDGERRRPK